VSTWCQVESRWKDDDDSDVGDKDGDNTMEDEDGEEGDEDGVDDGMEEEGDCGEDDFPHAYFFVRYLCDSARAAGVCLCHCHLPRMENYPTSLNAIYVGN
jgi:hypothetical protein